MWKIKVVIQFFLSKIPGGVSLNYFLQKIKGSHNEINNIKRIIELSSKLKEIDKYVPLDGCIVVEIGTGWEPISTLLLYLLGAKKIYTYDHVRHVRSELIHTLIKNIENTLDEIAQVTSLPKDVLLNRLNKLKSDGGQDSVDAFFKRANIIYHAPGDATNTGLQDKSVDLVYSYAVLEHVPKNVVRDLTVETKRILKPTGVAFHAIGLFDHYVTIDKKISRVNFLQYREPVWSFFVHNKISYHNRLREKQFVNIFSSCGATTVILKNVCDQSDLEALKTIRIDKMFDGMSHEELAIHHTELILSFPQADS